MSNQKINISKSTYAFGGGLISVSGILLLFSYLLNLCVSSSPVRVSSDTLLIGAISSLLLATGGHYISKAKPEIKLGGKLLAFFGQLNPLMLNDLNFKKECFAFEIFLDHLPEPKKIRLSKPLLKVSPFQSFFRDFSFVVDQDLESIQIVKTIKICKNLKNNIKSV